MAEILNCLPEPDPIAETVVGCPHEIRSACVTQLLCRFGVREVLDLEAV